MKRLVVQIPAYNEAESLPSTLVEIPRTIPGIDSVIVLVIDDGSSDCTTDIALKNGADYVIRHLQNRGLAKAFLTGIRTSLALGADVIVNTDADNQYPGKYIPDLVAPILEGKSHIVIGDRQVINNEHFSPFKQRLEAFGSWVMRLISQTDAPDAPSGFRSYSRYAALRLQVFNPYSYTLETLIQAGKDQMAITHLPIRTNASLRPSRLHKGILNFVWRQSGTIIRSYILYSPLKTFIQLSIPFLLSGSVLIFRFLYFYFTDQSGIGRHIQSVSIGGTLGVFGFLLLLLGILGDAVRMNRQIMEEILVSQRDGQKINENSQDYLGCKLFINKYNKE
jgi:glycosyltransferase involved in cell wall biosynthesis